MIQLKLKRPVLIFSALLFVSFSSLALALYIKPISPSLKNKHQSETTDKPSKSLQPKLNHNLDSTPAETATQNPLSSPSPVNNPDSTIPSPSPSPILTPSLNPEVNQITVSINNSPSFEVQVSPEADHCQVLTQALETGKITSLTMEYNETYKSYAVYQINDIGHPNQVFWTYQVNNNNPPLGCSHIKTENNDVVVWTYIGSP